MRREGFLINNKLDHLHKFLLNIYFSIEESETIIQTVRGEFGAVPIHTQKHRLQQCICLKCQINRLKCSIPKDKGKDDSTVDLFFGSVRQGLDL